MLAKIYTLNTDHMYCTVLFQVMVPGRRGGFINKNTCNINFQQKTGNVLIVILKLFSVGKSKKFTRILTMLTSHNCHTNHSGSSGLK